LVVQIAFRIVVEIVWLAANVKNAVLLHPPRLMNLKIKTDRGHGSILAQRQEEKGNPEGLPFIVITGREPIRTAVLNPGSRWPGRTAGRHLISPAPTMTERNRSLASPPTEQIPVIRDSRLRPLARLIVDHCHLLRHGLVYTGDCGHLDLLPVWQPPNQSVQPEYLPDSNRQQQNSDQSMVWSKNSL
ncbi:MAG: hypothetical protein HYT46_01165, partial [Candidatus Vogelbacteria bacterium]|nr:hypothetical protein [Candidatus Vogelbacteria bacterium]